MALKRIQQMSKYLIILFISAVSQDVTAQNRFITIDSHQVWVNTIGMDQRKVGEPVVVFESGLGTPMGNWDKVLKGVSALAPLVTYDRPGIGQSQSIEEMPTIKNVSDRLVRLLEYLHVDPPYVLIGHSLGGLYVRGFAMHYPELLAGLVIIDPADFTENMTNRRDYYDVLQWEDTKVDSLIQSFIDKRKSRSLRAPEPIQKEGQVLENLRANEFSRINKNKLPNIPVHIMTGGRFDLPKRFQSEAYDDEALFRSKMKHRLLRWTDVIQSVDKGMLFYSGDAGHFVHIDDPELLISSVRIVLEDYRTLQAASKR